QRQAFLQGCTGSDDVAFLNEQLAEVVERYRQQTAIARRAIPSRSWRTVGWRTYQRTAIRITSAGQRKPENADTDRMVKSRLQPAQAKRWRPWRSRPSHVMMPRWQCGQVGMPPDPTSTSQRRKLGAYAEGGRQGAPGAIQGCHPRLPCHQPSWSSRLIGTLESAHLAQQDARQAACSLLSVPRQNLVQHHRSPLLARTEREWALLAVHSGQNPPTVEGGQNPPSLTPAQRDVDMPLAAPYSRHTSSG